MKLKLIATLVVLTAVTLVGVTARAQQAEPVITQEKIALIKDHCVENQAALNRLHQTDAFLRNDRGNLYRTISDKLMVPLNQRLASNQLNGGELLNIAADFNRQYTLFYSAYIAYDNALSEVLLVDCSKQPVAYYNALLDAREKRTKISEINLELKRLITRYGTTFEDFKAKYVKENA